MGKALFSKKDKRFIIGVFKTSFTILFMILSALLFIFKFVVNIIISIFRLLNRFVSVRNGSGNIDILNNLTPRQFEVLCGELFKHEGYKVEVTRATIDYGRDIILKKNGEVTFVECKYYNGNNAVGREVCQKLIGATVMGKADKSIVITTGRYNANAFEVAREVDYLELMDIKDINNMIGKLDKYELNRVKLKLNNCA